MKRIVMCAAIVAMLCSERAFSQDGPLAKAMRECNARPEAKELHGDARKTFMASCLQKAHDSASPMIGSGRVATPKEAAPAKEAVSNQLKDPAAAQFRNLTYHDKTHAVCGEVNGKNSYGGYIGFRPFAFVDGKAVVMPSGDVLARLDAEKAIRPACE